MVALIAVLISFSGLLFVGLQLRDANKQRQSDSLLKIYEINRELLTLGFQNPVLFDILHDSKVANGELERRYLQLWLNQQSMIHLFLKNKFVPKEIRESLTNEMADMLTMANMQRHWQKRGSFYPASFRDAANELIEKSEPHKAAQVDL